MTTYYTLHPVRCEVFDGQNSFGTLEPGEYRDVRPYQVIARNRFGDECRWLAPVDQAVGVYYLVQVERLREAQEPAGVTTAR